MISNKSIYKIILIGSSSVGKTSLCHTIKGEMFNSRIPITIGVDYMEIKLERTKIGEKIPTIYNIQLWDTAGHESYHSITRSYYRGSNIILMCFDLTNRKSFIELRSGWKKSNQ